MLSKNKIKFIRSLELKKNRQQERLFVAEGPKVVADLLTKVKAHTIFSTPSRIKEFSSEQADSIIEITDSELAKISFLQHPQQVLAVFPFLPSTEATPQNELILALDGVQDPGNLGTIIRIADWFGIKNIICSEDTVDVYNPKVIQASMGSVAQVSVNYCDLKSFIENISPEVPVYGTCLDGENIYNQKLSSKGIIVMGNEGKGVSTAIKQLFTHKLLIPNYHPQSAIDSLNVAIATAITCAEFKRQDLV